METNTHALEDCPFCGGKPEIHFNVEDNFYFIECTKCFASSPVRFNSGEDARPHVINDWNNRINSNLQERINELESALNDLVEGYEQWEADIISNNAFWWPNAEKDALSDKLYEDMLLLQEKRNQAKQVLKPNK